MMIAARLNAAVQPRTLLPMSGFHAVPWVERHSATAQNMTTYGGTLVRSKSGSSIDSGIVRTIFCISDLYSAWLPYLRRKSKHSSTFSLSWPRAESSSMQKVLATHSSTTSLPNGASTNTCVGYLAEASFGSRQPSAQSPRGGSRSTFHISVSPLRPQPRNEGGKSNTSRPLLGPLCFAYNALASSNSSLCVATVCVHSAGRKPSAAGCFGFSAFALLSRHARWFASTTLPTRSCNRNHPSVPSPTDKILNEHVEFAASSRAAFLPCVKSPITGRSVPPLRDGPSMEQTRSACLMCASAADGRMLNFFASIFAHSPIPTRSFSVLIRSASGRTNPLTT